MTARVAGLALAIAAMAVVVVASNILVQFPFAPLGLQDILTWGAFVYPVAFLVTDLTNRRFGPDAARRVAFGGFAIAVAISVVLASPRIALASGAAFLIAQLTDVWIFDRLRRAPWWQAPLASSAVASVVDTALFFTIAFAGGLSVLGPNDAFAIESTALLGLSALEAPRWVSWALGDLGVKLIVALLLIAPFAALMRVVSAPETAAGAGAR